MEGAAADLALGGGPVQQVVGGTGAVGADQHVLAVRGRDLGDGPAQDVGVVGGGVRPGVPGRNVTASSSVVLSHHTPIGW